MEYETRVNRFRGLSGNALRQELYKAADIYNEAIMNSSQTDEIYVNRIALTLAILAAEDGHYYESEHLVMTSLFTDDVIRQMRYTANDIVRTDNMMGYIINQQAIFKKISYSATCAAIDMAACYFYLTGGMTPSRWKLMLNLFGSY